MIRQRIATILAGAAIALTAGCSAAGPEQQGLMKMVETAEFTEDPAIGMSKHWQQVEFAYLSQGHGTAEGQEAACLSVISKHGKRRNRHIEVRFRDGREHIAFPIHSSQGLAKRLTIPLWQDYCSEPVTINGGTVTYQRLNAFFSVERKVFDQLAAGKGLVVAGWTIYRAPDW